MKGLFSLALILFIASCRKAPAPSPAANAPAAGAKPPLIAYVEPSGNYRCNVPPDWRMLEDEASGEDVMFFGPGRVSIAIGKYPDASGRIQTPQDYWSSTKLSVDSLPPLEKIELNGAPAFKVSFEAPVLAPNGKAVLYVRRQTAVLIPDRRGFFALEHRAPRETAQETMPVFEAMAASFLPER